MSSQQPYYNANGIPIVQGTIVPTTSVNHSMNQSYINTAMTQKQQAVYGGSSSNVSYYNNNNNANATPMIIENASNIPHGEKQSNSCKDVIWAILFYVHLIVIAIVTAKYAPVMASDVVSEYGGGGNRIRRLSSTVASSATILSSTLKLDQFTFGNRILDDADADKEFDFDLNMNTIYTILAISGLTGLCISSVAMSLMMMIPTAMIKVALIFNIVITSGMVVLSAIVGAWPMVFMSLIGLLFTLYYTYIVWKRIPFAASTLVTAITAIQCNMGLTFFAYNNLIVTFLWSMWWSLAFVATSYVISNCDAEGYCENEINGGIIFLFLVSFFWVCQVIKNVVHCTVAGTVGTWWFIPGEAKSCCSSAVQNSYLRSVTTSFGPICFGSLIVAIIQATREIVNAMRTEENSLLLCLIDCVLGVLEYLAEMFNKWAYIYVGLYGYGFIEASINVLSLFKARGWTSIIADMLIDTVLLMVSLCVGVITGIIGAIVGSVMQQGNTVIGGAFLVGMIIGIVLCSTLFSLISSAVNAVIVCFAEAPKEFQDNHPQLSQQMLLAWRNAYPTEFTY